MNYDSIMRRVILFWLGAAAVSVVALCVRTVTAAVSDAVRDDHIVGGNATVVGNETVVGNLTVGGTVASGALSPASLAVTGATTVGTTLDVTGATTLRSTFSVVGAAALGGHVVTFGTVPTASAGTIDTKSTDHAGMVTSVGATSTIVTFASAYTAEPACVATAEEAVWISGKNTAGFTINAAGNIDDVSYICLELE